MNLQSNALKFTKEHGKITIVCQYVKGTFQDEPRQMKQKLMRLKGISSSSENKEDSKDSDNQRFEEDHKIKGMMDPLENRNKIVITVMDTGIV